MATTDSAVPSSTRRWQRLLGSAVMWAWLFNGLRLASGLLLLPLLQRTLSKPDLGIYYVFLDLAMVIPMADFGFALSVERGLAYARGGARSLEAIGVGAPGEGGAANVALMREVVASSRVLYRWLATGAFVLLGAGGTVLVGLRVGETSGVQWTWVAWAVQLVALTLEIYTGYWVAVLRGLNRVTSSARWLSLAYGLKLGVAVVLLRLGAGLMAVPVAGLVAGVVVRAGAGREVGGILGGWPEAMQEVGARVRRILTVLWPNSWRLGVQLVALSLSTNIYTYICVKHFGLEAKAEYGLSMQVMNIAVGIAGVWTSVKWPLVAQYRQRGDLAGIRGLIRPRFFLQVGTFAALAMGAVWLGPWLLRLIGANNQLLPRVLVALLALNSLGELHFSFWTTLISTENRIPALRALLATQAAAVALVAGLVYGGGRGLEAFVLGPLLAGAVFNYWWWAREGARMLGTTVGGFLFHSPAQIHGQPRNVQPS